MSLALTAYVINGNSGYINLKLIESIYELVTIKNIFL